jgi:hypothetical protein
VAARLTARKIGLVLAFAVPLLVYGLTLAPGLTWAHHGADGGDLITAAHTLGVPHPPGYPTFTLLAWLFTRLPLNSVAWRVNLLSAVSTAAAAALIYWTVIRLSTRQTPGDPDQATQTPVLFAGLGAAWSYAFAPLVWSQALIAEVYALAGLWTALILYLTIRPSSSPKRPLSAFTLGLLWSLGLGVHLTLIFLAPVVIQSFRGRRSVVGGRPVAVAVLGFLAGLLVWLYLPLRAGRGGVTWGQPTTLDGFWWMISGALYRDYVFALPISALGERLAAWAQTWSSGLGLIGVGLALWGMIGSSGYWRRSGPGFNSQGWRAASGLSFVAFNLYALGYHTTDSVVYLVPGFVIGGLWLGVGAAGLFHRIRKWGNVKLNLQQTLLPADTRRRWRPGGWTLLMLAIALAPPIWTLARNTTALDLSDDRNAENFGHAVMNEAPAGSVLLTGTDRQTFALWYYQRVEGLRPDVAVVDEGLWGFDWYRAGLGWDQTNTRTTTLLGAERPQCRVRREAYPEWLDCQD